MSLSLTSHSRNNIKPKYTAYKPISDCKPEPLTNLGVFKHTSGLNFKSKIQRFTILYGLDEHCIQRTVQFIQQNMGVFTDPVIGEKMW